MANLLRFLLILVILIAGCGGPTIPSPTTLAIAPSDDLLTTKTSVAYNVVGTFPDSSSRGVDARWVTDNPAVAAVSANGTVTGVGPGSTTLIATVNGHTTSRVLRVVPDFSGTWNGQSQITGCSSGDPRTCGRCCPNGQMHTISLTLSQARDVASGTLQLDAPGTATTLTYTGPVSGAIQLAGSLVLQGTLTGRFSDGLVIPGPTLFDWSTIVDTSGTSIVGQFTQITAAGFIFPLRVSSSLVVTKAGR